MVNTIAEYRFGSMRSHIHVNIEIPHTTVHTSDVTRRTQFATSQTDQIPPYEFSLGKSPPEKIKY